MVGVEPRALPAVIGGDRLTGRALAARVGLVAPGGRVARDRRERAGERGSGLGQAGGVGVGEIEERAACCPGSGSAQRELALGEIPARSSAKHARTVARGVEVSSWRSSAMARP